MATTLPAPASPVTRSSVSKKQVMAVTGLVMLGFIVAHVVGNLKFFFGPTQFDHYSHWLRTILQPALPHGWFLWLLRAVLSLALVLHIWAAVSTTLQSRKARPIRYEHTTNVQASYASRTMRWGGVIILLFLIFHLLDLSGGQANPGFVRGEVFRNTVATFERWYVSVAYIAAVGALCLHIYHGLWSSLQTLGVKNPQLDAPLHNASRAIAVAIFLGFISIPIAVLLGYRG